MKKERQLDAREREILDAIVRQYIATGFPIGSKAVAEHFPESLSAATIRNSMSDLEAAGFLSQPHISAGRIPTDKAYRFYVDRVAGTQKLSPATERFIDASLRSEEIHPDTLMGKISRVLSEVSHSVGLVLGPGLEEKLLEHISVHRWYMGEQQNRPIPFTEAVQSWYHYVYLPLVEIIRQQNVLEHFPGGLHGDRDLLQS